MIVDVSKNKMSVGEACIDTIRQIDSIVYEAQMDIMVAEYNYLAETGEPLMITDGSENSIFKRVRNAIVSIMNAVKKFFADLKEKISKKIQKFKNNVEIYKAYYKLGRDLERMYEDLLKEQKEAERAAKKAEGDMSKIRQVLNNFKEKCHKSTKEAKEKYVTVDVYDADGNRIHTTHTTAKVSEA